VPIQRELTPRQHQILRSVARGKTNKDIAADLGISEQGVKVHISRLLERYGAENRVELVSLSRAWPDADGNGFADLAGDIAGIRAGLDKTYEDAGAISQKHTGNGTSAAPRVETNGHAPGVGSDMTTEVRSLRDLLAEIDVALKIARELPADANVGPLVDTIRARVRVALERSARLDAFVDRQRTADRRSRHSAS
jgi:DNA-binding CsgD family transcriptional regulator